MDTQFYSRELQNVISYMIDVLSKEFPCEVFTPEYLITSILDNKKCKANNLLDNCLMSSHMEELRDIYAKHLLENVKPHCIDTKNDIKYNEDLQHILDNAFHEKDILNSKTLGTEHVLLSFLNPTNRCSKIKEVFKNMGVTYQFILDKCHEKTETNNILQKKTKKTIGMNKNIMPFQGNNELQQKFISAVKSEINFIKQYTVSLNQLARDGKIDKLIGRDKELSQIVKVLARRNKNNVILVGSGGCGKTALVYGIADLIEKDEVPEILQGKEIVMLDITSIISGTSFRGMFEERINGLFNELKNNSNYILFIDDMHNVLKSSQKERDTDISSMIGNILQEGDVRVIGTTTFKNYRNSIESNSSIARKMQKIVIEPNSIEETIKILLNNKHYYEEYHNVYFGEDVIKRCVELSHRYISDRSLPDSAIDVVDLSGARTALISREPSHITNAKQQLKKLDKTKEEAIENGDFEVVDDITLEENKYKKLIADYKRDYQKNSSNYTINITVDDICTSISEITNIPINKLNSDDKSKLANIDKTLKEVVIGQDEAVETICKVVKRNKVGLGNKNKTQSNLLLLGPSGSGKSLIAKKLAEEVYGDEKALVRFDMSEYSEKNSVAKLLGSAPGYIGYENGGQLTEAIKNKQHCVLLLDEIEKADPEVYNVFLQLFDEGRLTDSSGQLINFKNVIVIMTSNVGVKQANEMGQGIGFSADENTNKKSIIEKQLKKKFAPEFINRLDKIVYFNTLSDENLKDIVKLECNKFKQRLNEIHYDIEFDEGTINYLHSKAILQKEFGARPIIRLIQDNIEDVITDLLLQNEYKNNYKFKTIYENESIRIS